MKKKRKGTRKTTLFLSIILVFCILGTIVFSVAKKISEEMATSAIHNLNASLDLIQNTIEAILVKETEFQLLIAQEIASAEDPYEFIRSYESNRTMVKLSLIPTGKTEGISSSGDAFTEQGLDFSFKKTVNKLPLSQSYLNSMGTWAYTMKCPVTKDGKEIATLYVEYTFDSFEDALPDGFYNNHAQLYIMDTKSQRLVLKPTGMGERDAGHLNLADFYRANNILEEDIQKTVSTSIENGDNVMFYHDIRNKNSLIYMWAANDGAIYLIGYVPIEAIQQEGRSVSQNIFIVAVIMLTAFVLCCILYYFSKKEDDKLRKERELEREVHNKQLAEALQAAQIASKSKTTFLSNMSHDIRTPMNAILGFTTLLDKDADNPAKVRDYTKKITSSGQHLLSLINDVLDVSKIESGKVVLTIGEFTLNSLVSSVDAIIRPMAKEKAQNFYVSVTDIKHEYLIGDKTRINQILINLLSNAVKYTPECGSIWFRIIGLEQRSSQFEHIRIEVEDDGYGMTREYLKTIFDAFTRAENSTTNKVQGTGLGMAITKNIVELMGGTIEVTSEVDQGSLFQVDLEFRIPEGQADRLFWEKSGISRILAVDGNMQDCNTIQNLVSDLGISVDIVACGEGALSMLREDGSKGSYHMVLLDLDAPDMGDIRTVEEIRKALPETAPLLLMTAQGAEGPDSMEEVLRLGYTGVLTKPFFLSALKEKVAEIQAGGAGKMGEAQTDEEGSLEGLRFLAAEDNEINAEILTEILTLEGAVCVLAENGKLVLERFEESGEGEFDAILMDVQMPVMNGYDATRAIRDLGHPMALTIPIIAMTANAFAEDEREALKAGMNVHLAKPIDMGMLKKVIRQYVRKEGKQ